MRTIGIILLIIVIALAGCGKKAVTYTINGTWDGGDGNVVYLKKALGDKQYETVDSAVVTNGLFQMRNELKEVDERTLVVNGASTMLILDSVPITVTCENVKKTVRGKETTNVKTEIKGSLEQEIFKSFMMAQRDEMIVMFGISFMGKDEQKSQGRQDTIIQLYTAAKNATAHVVDSLTGNYKDSYAVALIINNFLTKQRELDEVEKLYNELSDRVKASYPGQQLSATIGQLKTMTEGSAAPDFTLQAPDGKNISLSDYKGKYILLDFWASWCAPCLREVPNMKKIYDKYQPMGFEILSVSLDDKKDNWVSAIEKHELNWVHVSSLKGWNCPVVKQYNVNGVPAMFLLDKEGKILASGLRGEELSKKITSLYE